MNTVNVISFVVLHHSILYFVSRQLWANTGDIIYGPVILASEVSKEIDSTR